MRMFLKHIFRDIKKFPAQPILIILTLILSVSCAVTAFCTQRLFEDHAKALSGADTELGDIIISSGTADTRILFESDAKDALGNNAEILGDFKLTGFSENEKSTVSISATDLVSADKYFDFSYIEYGKFTAENLNASAVVSKSFANQKTLSVGDSLTVTFLGKEFTYTVEAIADNTGLLAEQDMIVSFDSILAVLAEEVPAIGALGSVMPPYTRIMVKASDGSSPDLLLKKLKSVPEFEGYRIESTENSAQKDFLFLILRGAVWLIASIIILLASILTGTALKLLESKRRIQYAAFSAAGASRGHIGFLRYSESFIYSVIGAIFGILLSLPMTQKIGSLFEWNSEPLTVGIGGIIFGAVFSPALILFCTAIHIHKQKALPLAEQLFSEEDEKTSGEKLSKAEAVILPSLIAVCALSFQFIPVAKRFIPAFILLPLVIRSAYVFIPAIIRSISKNIADKASTLKKCRGKTILLARSFSNRFELRHISRLTVILLALLFSVNLCRSTLGGVMSKLDSMVTADIAAVGVGEAYYGELQKDPAVDSSAQIGVFRGTELPSGYTLTSISVSGDVSGCIDEELIPTKLPVGNSVVISEGIAKLCGTDVGDTLPVKIKGTEYRLTVSEITNTGISVLFIDADALGLGHDAVCVNFKESANEAIKKDFVSKLEANGAAAVEPKYLFGSMSATANGFMSLLKYSTSAAALLSFIGCLNSLAAFYRSRKREFGILKFSGMTRARLIGNIALEFAIMLIISLIFAIPVCAALSGVIDTVMSSFGFSIFM